MDSIGVEETDQRVNVRLRERQWRIRVAEGPDELDDVSREVQPDRRTSVAEVQFEQIIQIFQMTIQRAVETVDDQMIDEREKRVQIGPIDFAAPVCFDRRRVVALCRSFRRFQLVRRTLRLTLVFGHEQPFEIIDHHVDRALVEDLVVILQEFQPDLREQTLLHVALKPLPLHLMSGVDVRAGEVEQREEVMPQTNRNQRRLEVEFQ